MVNIIALQTIALRNLTNWSVQYLMDASFSYNKDYELVEIGDFLTRNKTPILIQDDQKYKRVTIKIRNGGVFLRDIEIGSSIGTKKQFTIEKGQFLLSKIDARNGAFGVVPDKVDGAIITGNFWAFDVDYLRINPHFLALIVTTPEFIRFCENASNGTTNRHYLQEDLFLAQQIPLPSLEEQNRIVDNYNTKIRLAKQQEVQAQELEKEVERYFLNELGLSKFDKKKTSKGLKVLDYSKLKNWSLTKVLKQSKFDISSGKFKTESLNNLLVYLKGGKTPSKQRKDYWNGNINWTSPKDFTDIYISSSEDSISDKALRETNIEVFPKGTILSVFRSGILRHSFPTALTTIETTINQDVKAYKFNSDSIDDFYYLYFVDVFKDYILFYASKKGVTVESIRTKSFLELLIPLPPLSIQKKIVVHITKLKNQIQSLYLQADKNRKTAVSEFEGEVF